MILISVGTEQYPFNALMDWVDLLIRYQFIEPGEEVVVQYGSSNRLPDRVRIYQRLPEVEFRRLVEEARVIIAHCGEGTALLLENYGKPYILVPRTQQFGEHVDDHQLEMADAMEKQGVSIARSPGDLVRFLADPKVSTLPNQENGELCHVLSRRYSPQQYRKLMLVCSSGGHFKAMQNLQPFWEPFAEIAWVTFRSGSTESELRSRPHDRSYWAFSPTNRNIPNLIRNLLLATRVVGQERPDLVVSTGAGVAVPFLLLAKYLFRSQVVFVESKTRLQQLSLSARLLRGMGALDQLVVQSQELHDRYPDALWVKDDPTATPTDSSPTAPLPLCFPAAALLKTPPHFGGSEVEAFLQQVRQVSETQFKQAPSKLVVDMSATRSLDRAGLGALFSGLKLVKSLDGELVLWSVHPSVMTVLTRARFDRLFTIETSTATVRFKTRPEPVAPVLIPEPLVLQNPVLRALDVAIALLGLFVTALLALPIAIALQIESPGPVLVQQFRCGFLGRRIPVWQFRTTAGDACLTPATPTDRDRCDVPELPTTWVGRGLRWARLEQLPLFWHVLIGDLSLFELQSVGLESVNLESVSANGDRATDGYARSARPRGDHPSTSPASQKPSLVRIPAKLEEYEDTVRL